MRQIPLHGQRFHLPVEDVHGIRNELFNHSFQKVSWGPKHAKWEEKSHETFKSKGQPREGSTATGVSGGFLLDNKIQEHIFQPAQHARQRETMQNPSILRVPKITEPQQGGEDDSSSSSNCNICHPQMVSPRSCFLGCPMF